MRLSREPRQSVLSLKVTANMRRTIEKLAATMTISSGQKYTMTDIVEMAIRELASRKKLKT